MPLPDINRGGWNIEEAMKRCVSQSFFRREEAAHRAWVAAGKRTRRPAIRSFWEGNPHTDAREAEAYQRYVDLRASIRDRYEAFRELMVGEKLFAWGRSGKATADPELIPGPSWKYLKFQKDPTKLQEIDGTFIVDLQIFPLAHHLTLPEKLAGLSLAQAFKACVLDDPEVQARGSELIEKEGHSDVFEKGQFPGPIVKYAWPVETSQRGFERDFTRRILWVEGEPDPTISDEVQNASGVLNDRWQALRALLSSGSIVARGTFAKTGIVQTINSAQWAREAILVDIRNSDVLERVDSKEVVQWSAVELARPNAVTEIASKPSEVRRQATDLPTPKSRVQKSIYEACKSIWPEGIPLGISKQRRNEMIMEEQRRLGLSVASDKSLQRYIDQA